MANVANTKLSTVLQLRDISGSSAPEPDGSLFYKSSKTRLVGALSGSGVVEGHELKANSLDVQNGGISNAGPIAGGTTLALSGLASVASISMDNGSTLGPDAVADLITFSSEGDITVKDGTFDLDIAAHDGSNGLKLGGTLVTAGAAELNYTDVTTPGTAEASKALVLDSNKNIGTINQITASHAKIGTLDVDTINSRTVTESILEVADKTIIAGLSGSASDIDGGGLRFGGSGHEAGLAEILFKNDTHDELEFKLGGTLRAKVTAQGAVSASGDVSGVNGDFDGAMSALGGFAVGANTIVNGSRELQNIASLDTTTEATIEAAIDRLNNLTSAGSASADLDIQGPLNLKEGLKANDTLIITDQLRIQNVTRVSSSGDGRFFALDVNSSEVISSDLELKNIASLDDTTKATIEGAIDTLANLASAGTNGQELEFLGSIDVAQTLKVNNAQLSDASRNLSAGTVTATGVVSSSAAVKGQSLDVNNGAAIVSSYGALTGSNGAQFKEINSNTSVVSFHAGDTPSTSNWMVLIKSGSSSGAANHSLNLNASSAESAHLSFFDTSVAPNGEDKANLKYSSGLMIMSSSTDISLRTGTGAGGTVGVQNLLHVSGNCKIDGDLTLPSSQTITAGDFVALSDRGLKQDIAPMNGALEKIMQLEPVTYELKAKPGVADLGFIAQDVAKVIPEVCAVDANGIGRGIDYGRMSAILAGAVKTQQLQIEELKTIVAKLQK